MEEYSHHDFPAHSGWAQESTSATACLGSSSNSISMKITGSRKIAANLDNSKTLCKNFSTENPDKSGSSYIFSNPLDQVEMGNKFCGDDNFAEDENKSEKRPNIYKSKSYMLKYEYNEMVLHSSSGTECVCTWAPLNGLWFAAGTWAALARWLLDFSAEWPWWLHILVLIEGPSYRSRLLYGSWGTQPVGVAYLIAYSKLTSRLSMEGPNLGGLRSRPLCTVE
ncbi:hypothetical protein LguiA_008178 [Lonicera macranthoides]